MSCDVTGEADVNKTAACGGITYCNTINTGY